MFKVLESTLAAQTKEMGALKSSSDQTAVNEKVNRLTAMVEKL